MDYFCFVITCCNSLKTINFNQLSFINKTLRNLYIEKQEVAARGVLWKKVFLKILQNPQENTSARVSVLIDHVNASYIALVSVALFCFYKTTFLSTLFYPIALDISVRL